MCWGLFLLKFAETINKSKSSPMLFNCWSVLLIVKGINVQVDCVIKAWELPLQCIFFLLYWGCHVPVSVAFNLLLSLVSGPSFTKENIKRPSHIHKDERNCCHSLKAWISHACVAHTPGRDVGAVVKEICKRSYGGRFSTGQVLLLVSQAFLSIISYQRLMKTK
jgi:hypothetical protein